MTAQQAIPVRRMGFQFPEDMELVFIEDDPAMSYVFVGGWMMLPHLEPFLIRSVQAAMPLVTDEKLREEMKRFCAQEGQHFRQHAAMNEVVKRIHPAGEKLAELEAEVAAEFTRWSAEKPLKFNLAYGEGFESMTCAAARSQIDTGLFDHMKEPIRSLMYWHIMEEIEHRTVCFDVYEQVVGDWLYRTRMSLWFQRHYIGWVKRFAGAMLAAEPDLLARYDAPELKAARKARMDRYSRTYLPRYLATFLPWYNPARLPLPKDFERTRETFTAMAVGVQ